MNYAANPMPNLAAFGRWMPRNQAVQPCRAAIIAHANITSAFKLASHFPLKTKHPPQS